MAPALCYQSAPSQARLWGPGSVRRPDAGLRLGIRGTHRAAAAPSSLTALEDSSLCPPVSGLIPQVLNTQAAAPIDGRQPKAKKDNGIHAAWIPLGMKVT